MTYSYKLKVIDDTPLLLITVEFYSQEVYLDKGQLQVLCAFLEQARPRSFSRKLVYCKPQKPALPGEDAFWDLAWMPTID